MDSIGNLQFGSDFRLQPKALFSLALPRSLSVFLCLSLSLSVSLCLSLSLSVSLKRTRYTPAEAASPHRNGSVCELGYSEKVSAKQFSLVVQFSWFLTSVFTLCLVDFRSSSIVPWFSSTARWPSPSPETCFFFFTQNRGPKTSVHSRPSPIFCW